MKKKTFSTPEIKKLSIFSRILKGPIISILILLIGGIYLYRKNESLNLKSLNSKTPSQPNTTQGIIFEMQWSNEKKTFHKLNTPMDVCRIMPQCFGESKTHKTHESCSRPILSVIEYYHNGYLIDNGKVVGFCSIYPYTLPHSGYTMIMIYNVCIDKEFRSKGFGKRIVNQSIDAVINKFNLPKEKVVLALDVDLRSPTAGDAFAVYSKMGFMRWVAPCDGIHKYDFMKAVRNSSSIPSLENNFVSLYRDDANYIEKIYNINNKDKTYKTHFCMYKLYNDSFQAIGNKLKDQISKLDAKYGNTETREDSD